MILTIGDLAVPETLSGNAELFNTDSIRRTINMRLIRKSSLVEKWRVTLNYEGRAILPELRRALYETARLMRSAPRPVTFISPYDDTEIMVSMLCTQPFPPKILLIRDGSPLYYINCGAVFEEI